MKAGQSLSQITRDFCKAWGIHQVVIPMSDNPVRTIVETDQGELAFQEYFVHRRCEPRVKGFRFDGIESAKPAPGIIDAIKEADTIVICPSNPWVSIDPILKVLSAPLVSSRHSPQIQRIWGRRMGAKRKKLSPSPPSSAGKPSRVPPRRCIANLESNHRHSRLQNIIKI